MRTIVLILLLCVPLTSFGVVRTLTGSGNWSTSGNWSGGNIANAITDDVSMNNNVSIQVLNGESFGIGNLTAGNNNILTIAAGGTLTLGAPGNLKVLNAGNNLTINVAGTLVIYGDVTIPNNLIWSVTGAGSVTITGNVTLSNNASITVNGNLSIGGNISGGANTTLTVNGNMAVAGNFTFANNTNVTVNGPGSIDVGGTTTVGGGGGTSLNLNGGGTFHSHGVCSGPAAFCTSSGLPLTLVSFSAHPQGGYVRVKWSTESELNVDYFAVQRSAEGKDFYDIGTVRSGGVNFSGGDYTYQDAQPIFGKAYYRLKEVDLNGQATFLRVVLVDFLAEKSVLFYPNPVSNGQLSLSANFDTSSSYRVSIFDLTGRVLKEFTDNRADLKITMDAAPGLYFVRFESHDYHTVSKIVVK